MKDYAGEYGNKINDLFIIIGLTRVVPWGDDSVLYNLLLIIYWNRLIQYSHSASHVRTFVQASDPLQGVMTSRLCYNCPKVRIVIQDSRHPDYYYTTRVLTFGLCYKCPEVCSLTEAGHDLADSGGRDE